MFRSRLPRLALRVAGVTVSIGMLASLVAADEPELPKIPPPRDLTLQTKDGLALATTYYPSYVGQDAVPVVLLHASKGTRGDLTNLALLLQAGGHAVVAPDLRGHGDSVLVRPERSDLSLVDYQAMVDNDVEAIKTFLFGRNNAGELNVDKLCVVGVEMGAAVAINWAALDWHWPVLATGKQGQDVKALVLISPEWTFRGLKIQDALEDPRLRSELSLLIVTGRNNSRLVQEANRLMNTFERSRAAQPADPPGQEPLWLRTPSTNLQGTRLLNEASLHIDEVIAKFIEVRLAKPRIPWIERKAPIP